MMRAWLFALVAFPLLCGSAAATAASAGQVEVVTTPGGLTAWLVRQNKVPLISLRFAFRGGGALDPKGKEGLANLVSGLLDEGAGELDSLAFQTRIEELAVHLGFDADRDYFYGNFATLTRNREAGFELLRLALNSPRFDPEPLERVRRQVLVGLMRDLEEPGTVAGRDWFKTVFGEHPYWHSSDGTVEGVEAIRREDLTRFVARRFARDQLTLAVVGDIGPEELGPLLDRAFGSLPAQGAPVTLPPPRLDFDGSTKVIRRPVPQSAIFLGMPGIKRDDPDWYVADLMNQVLGQGQSSRLYTEVREKRGLAYVAYSHLAPFEETGLFLGGSGTRNERVRDTLETMKAEFTRLREGGITETELADAKTYINGSFPLRLTSSGAIARLLLAMQLNRLGIDYLARRPEIYNRITRDDVARVAKRLLKPELMRVVIVGDPRGFD